MTREARSRTLRRRRLWALGAVAAVAATLGAAVGAVSGDDAGEGPAAAAALPAQCTGDTGSDLRTLAGQRLVVRTDGTPDRDLRRSAQRGEIAGVIVFPDEATSDGDVRRGIRQLQAAAAAGDQPPLLVSTDQEGGLVKRFPEGPPLRAPSELAIDSDAADARLEGRATGSFLADLGINVDLAPVLDVPASPDAAIAFRAFGDSAEQVSTLGLGFAGGLAAEDVLATAKHFPGIGRSVLNTDLSPSEIDASRRELAADLKPFQAAIAQNIPLIMIGVASYPEIGVRDPAALERSIATKMLRGQLGFRGVSITDDLGAEAVAASFNPREAAQRAAAAGEDLLLFANSSAPGVLEHLQRALATGRLAPASAQESCERVIELRESVPRADPSSRSTGG